MTTDYNEPTQCKCPQCGLRMKIMETRKDKTTGQVRRRFACLRGCGNTLHTTQNLFKTPRPSHV